MALSLLSMLEFSFEDVKPFVLSVEFYLNVKEDLILFAFFRFMISSML